MRWGYEKPSAIQQRAVLPIIQGRDVIAQAQSDDEFRCYDVLILLPVITNVRRMVLNCIIGILIQDESDEMLNRGFKQHIYDIYRALRPELQVCPFTMDLMVLDDLVDYFFEK
ncbi:hypothetical protein GIB67_019152 [Kingdonia uniflora]|uniref:Uncharacterized protein n=1 Tax=Kingdonia uniflora TaxID=39325 RepID=A0A7J7MZQ6_9MAGN|nr:hypothetical protein GIB67_019152 [Kingdonia uniflora]